MDSLRFEAVLPNEFYEDVTTEQFWVGVLKDAKSASAILKGLRDALPMSKSLQHVKRIRRVEQAGNGPALHIVLCPIGTPSSKDFSRCKDMLQSLGIDVTAFAAFSLADVPIAAPLTTEQWRVANARWPVACHEDKKVTQIREGNMLSKSDLLYVAESMQVAIDAARHSRTHGKPPIAAVIADPQRRKVLAVGTDGSVPNSSASARHILKHSVMVCIDDLAEQQGGGAWNTPACCDELVALRARSLSAELDGKSRLLAVAAASSPPPAAYLATGYDMFVTQEPCVMCSMALVHSRIGRVFYGTPYNGHGGLGSAFKIHCQPGINHRFDVYRGVCDEQCRELWRSCHVAGDT